MSWICYGYEVKCQTTPKNLSFPNAGSYTARPKEVETTIEEDIEEGSFRVVDPSFANVVNSIQLEPKGEAWRICHNTQYLNSKTAAAHFHLATLKKSIEQIVQKDDVLLTTDLKKAYYAVPLAKVSWSNMCFMSEAPRALLCATVLPFGFSLAPFVFHKITRQMVVFAGLTGHRLMSYIDDFLWASSPERAEATKAFALWLTAGCGWQINSKTDLTFATTKKFLGLLIDTSNYRFILPPNKKVRLTEDLQFLLQNATSQKPVSRKEVESLVGKVVAADLAIPLVRAFTRDLYELLGHEGRQKQIMVTLGQAEILEVRALLRLLHEWGGRGQPIPSSIVEADVFSDAGEFGFGGHYEDRDCWGELPLELLGTSSTRREIFGMHACAQRFVRDLRGKHVKFWLDSKAAMYNMRNQGGKVRELRQAFLAWFDFCQVHHIYASYEWLPREENRRADALSKTLTQLWHLEPRGITFLSHVSPLPHVIVDFNRLSLTLTQWQAAGGEFLLVHPIWPAMPWWSRLVAATVQCWELPIYKADVCLRCTNGVQPPRWPMRASQLSWRRGATLQIERCV